MLTRYNHDIRELRRLRGIQGTVQLRAIVSRTGTIENLTVVSGHSMLVAAAVEAVKQWRYRPYMLNGEPIEVETEITVNFMLAGHYFDTTSAACFSAAETREPRLYAMMALRECAGETGYAS